jgi:general secretion pathway protein E
MQAVAVTGLVLIGLIQSPEPETMKLLFNPIKLAGFVVWVYLCIYFVQHVEFSALVPKNHKGVANIITLFLGPILLLALFMIDAVRRYSQSGRGIMAFLRREAANAVQNIKEYKFVGSRGRSSVILLDPSGKSLSEVYGKEKRIREKVTFTKQIITDAIEQQASDILIDPKDTSSYTIRYRVDGVLRAIRQIDVETASAVVNSVKAVSGMDIAERRRPQDGGFTAKMPNRTVSFRVASAGALNGEKLAIRVLGHLAGILSLSEAGLTDKQHAILENTITKPSGMVLLCGPTGSGKTTTLYAMLDAIDFYTRNVVTVEDPIEYVLPQASQIEINPKAGITFAKALRSILRQDPDVICVGEIRDEETADIAMRASQTGHLVLATMHGGSHIASLVRLLDLGITPLLLASALSVVISQRLVRLLCKNCKTPADLTQEQVERYRRFGVNPTKIHRANGCEQCYGTGYKGRIGVFDVLVMDNVLKDRIINDELSIAKLKEYRGKRAMSNLRQEGMKRVYEGLTTIEEVERVTSDIGG